MATTPPTRAGVMRAGVTLTWTPLGIDGPAVVRASGRLYERLAAARDRRPRRGLLHAALTVDAGDGTGPALVEMTPVWGQPAGDRGVVAEGAVGARVLGRSRFFRYEVRLLRGQPHPPDDGRAVARVRLADDAATARRLLDVVRTVPTLVWGRRAPGTREMWTSNSVVGWLLTTCAVDPAALAPPSGWRAPGWDAGVTTARSGCGVPHPGRG